jgi:hypothetical protein
MVSTECARSFNKYLFQQKMSYRAQFTVSFYVIYRAFREVTLLSSSHNFLHASHNKTCTGSVSMQYQ